MPLRPWTDKWLSLVEQTFTSHEPLLPYYYVLYVCFNGRSSSSQGSWKTTQFCFLGFLLLPKWKHLRFGEFHHSNVRNPFLFNPRWNLPNVGFYSLQSRRREMCFAYKMLLLLHGEEPWIKYRNKNICRKKNYCKEKKMQRSTCSSKSGRKSL